jgi:GR25 family glycosyltransferase involved in LPS biosynthesis
MAGPYSINYSFGNNQTAKPPERQLYRGLFINLDSSTSRRHHMEAELRKYQLQDRYARFPAVDGRALTGAQGAISAGERACFQSHVRALESAKAANGTVHILEDDVVLSLQLEQIISGFDAGGMFDYFDLIFTDIALGLDILLLRRLKTLFDAYRQSQRPKFDVLDFNNVYQAGFQSYLVPRKSLDKVLSALRRGLDAGPNVPIDIFVRRDAQEGRLRLGCIFPFVTSVQLGDAATTTLADRAQNTEITREIVALLRYSFFVGRDLKAIPESLLTRLYAARGDDYDRLITAVLGFVVSSSEFVAH